MTVRLANFPEKEGIVTESWEFPDAGIRYMPIKRSEERHRRYIELMNGKKESEIIKFPARSESRLSVLGRGAKRLFEVIKL